MNHGSLSGNSNNIRRHIVIIIIILSDLGFSIGTAGVFIL